MKNFTFVSLLAVMFLTSCNNDPATPNQTINCADYASELDLSAFCGLDVNTHFEQRGVVDLCHVDSDDDYPHAELIYIFLANGFTADLAREEYEELKEQDRSAPSFTQLSGIGDDAYAMITYEDGDFIDHIIYEILIDIYLVQIEINLVFGGDNCLDKTSVDDFARAVIAPLRS